MPDPQATTTMVSLKKKLDGARELRGLILRHRANVLTRRASWRNLLWKPWQASASSGRWFPPAPGARKGRGVATLCIGLLIAWLPLSLVGLWFIYRIVRGWLRLMDHRPMYA
jgi:hypothetical protein